MGRIHVLSEQVANKIAAGEVVERPSSVVKELLENSLDAGATRLRIQIEGGGKKLIHIVDDGCGMVRDDAMLAFERHATSKIRDADDLLSIATLGFRGEALPSIASVSRLRLETRAPEEPSGTVVEVNGGKLSKVEEAGLPPGTSITVRDLFYCVPARRKFLRSESTEIAQIASVVTNYALAHPEKHFELHTATNAMLVAPPVEGYRERVYQIFGRETLEQMIPLAAMLPLARVGLPQPPPWKRTEEDAEESTPGELKVHGFVSKPEVQKLNRNSIFVFINGRLIRDKLVQHALIEAYRNILPPTVFPVVLLFLEMPLAEVDVNVHPSKVEVRFRQGSVVHDFVRDSVRAALMKARPVPQFTREITAQPTASPHLSPNIDNSEVGAPEPALSVSKGKPGFGLPGDFDFSLRSQEPPSLPGNLNFPADSIYIEANAAIPVARFPRQTFVPDNGCSPELKEEPAADVAPLASLKPVGQVRDSFILAINGEGLWIVDQHVAHERVLFEKVLKQRAAMQVETQRLLMPIILELTPAQVAIFSEICDELRTNGFDADLFGSRSIAVKAAPGGVQTAEIERMLHELLDEIQREEQQINLEKVRARIAASIACHAAIKINTPLTQDKMEWLLKELAKTECPMSCPHGRPVVLRYSVTDIQKAFKRI